MNIANSIKISYFIFFLTFFSFNLTMQECSKSECPNRKNNQYLNYEKIKKLSKKCTSNNECTAKVRCYSNGLWWVCPNPHSAHRSEAVQKQYDLGMFTSRDNISLEEKDFCDDENWDL